MDKYQFADCFFPIAKFRWADQEKMKSYAQTYFEILRGYDIEIVREACHQFAETWDLFKNFPSPSEFKMRCWQMREEKNQFKLDRRIGSRPQDIEAQVEFYDTVKRLTQKHGNPAPDGFVTPLFGVYKNCVDNLNRMETYHRLHGDKTESEVR